MATGAKEAPSQAPYFVRSRQQMSGRKTIVRLLGMWDVGTISHMCLMFVAPLGGANA
jgi:hypothetical protein